MGELISLSIPFSRRKCSEGEILLAASCKTLPSRLRSKLNAFPRAKAQC